MVEDEVDDLQIAHWQWRAGDVNPLIAIRVALIAIRVQYQGTEATRHESSTHHMSSVLRNPVSAL